MFSILQRHLYSTAGEAGIADLFGRVQIWIAPLIGVWRLRHETDGISELATTFANAIRELDRFDLRPQQVRLRPATEKEPPVGVICKLTRALIEHFAEGDRGAENDTLQALAMVGRSEVPIDFDLGFRAALAEFLIETGDYDRAVAAIDENLLSRSLCSYSDYLLFQALSKQRAIGAVGGSFRIGLSDLSDRFCEQPFNSISTSPPTTASPIGHGSSKPPLLYACRCPSMMLYPIGNASVEDASQEFEDIWNGPEIQEIRRSIIDGDFTYCSRTICPYILNGDLPRKDEISDPTLRDIIDEKRTRVSTFPHHIAIGHDAACNLACPTCRTELMTTKSAARNGMNDFVDRMIIPLLEGTDVSLIISGNGDPFASKHYRWLLENIDPVQHKGVKLWLQTNGLLFTPTEWQSLSRIHHLIAGVSVSIDAATAATYEDVRRPGKWDALTENMDFLAGLHRTGQLTHLCICFVVQKKNFMEMAAFVELGRRWGVSSVFFNKAANFGTFDAEEYKKNTVFSMDHHNDLKFLEMMKNPILRSNNVNLFNVAPYLQAL